jgi:glutamyl-tRNA synthetase
MALFNWLFARKMGGTFVLRLEDTDAERTDEAFVQAMCEGFHWLGIRWDEGPAFGDEAARGDHGPYRQSERREAHRAEALRLVAEGKAYKCFLTKEELEARREEARAAKKQIPLRSPWRDASEEEIAAQGDASYVVRFKVPEGETVVNDLVQGPVRTRHTELDDFVILKPNGDPIFHLAVVCDDAHMKITHVIRGDDHLTNTSRHVLLFEALGYDLPQFAHLPMVLDDKGKKFSKREHGANVLDWRRDGYLAEALINYVALLGWTSTEENREFFTLEELQASFTPDRWGKSAARFDVKKFQWLNGQHIRNLPVEELRDRIVPILNAAGCDTRGKSEEWLTALAEICREKLPTLNDIVTQADFFFTEITEYEEKGVKKQWEKDFSLPNMEAMVAALEQVENWRREVLHECFEGLSVETDQGLGKFVNPARLALTGKTVGPGFFELAELLGKETCLARMRAGVEYIKGMAARDA